jgi:hypothetical protein
VYYPDDGGSSSLIAGISYLIFGVLYFLIFVAWYVVSSWFTGRVFAKAGIPQWKGWVPFYNIWVFLELGGQPGWLAVLAWIPGANLVTTVFRCIAAYRIGLGFGKQGAWVVLYIFVSIIWLGIVGLDRSRWEPWRIPGPGAPYGYQPPAGYPLNPPPAG